MNAQESVNLLLVDDRPENLLAFEAVLDGHGYHLFKADSGAGALRLAQVHEFAVILLDLQMPVMDGFETAARLRASERAAQTPIIFVTANYTQEVHVARGYGLGAVDYLIKPVAPEVLLSKVAAYVDLFKGTRELAAQAQTTLAAAHQIASLGRAEPAPPPPAALPGEERVSILVANDDPNALRAIQAALEGENVDILTARTGREALGLLLKHQPALVLLDVHMPELDGFETAPLIRQNARFRHTPILFHTASSQAEADVTRGYAIGALDFIFVPINPELLRAKVQALLNQFRQQRLLAGQVREIEWLNRELTASHGKVQALNADLEHQVQERTAELSEANESMRREITERRQAEEAIRESETQFRSMTEQSLVGIVIIQAGQIKYANPALIKMLGYSPAELLAADSVLEFVAEADRAVVQENLRLRETGEIPAINYSFRARRKDGALRNLEVFGSRVFFQGHPAVMSTVLDVTESRRREAALKLFRALVDQSNDTIEVVDPETGRFLDVNEKGCRDLGYSREEFLALSVFDVDPTVNQSSFPRALEALRKSGVLRREGSHRRKDGSVFPVEVSIKHVLFDREYAVAVVRDITERKRMEEEMLLLQTLTLAVAEAPDFESVLQVTVQRVCEASGWALGESWVPRPDGGALVIGKAWHAAIENAGSFIEANQQISFPPEYGLPGRV